MNLMGEGFLKRLLKYIPNCVFWKNTDFVYQGCNQNFLKFIGYDSLDQLIGKTDYDLPIGKTADICREEDEYIIASGKSIDSKKVSMRNLAGKEIVISISKNPIYDDNDHIVGILGMYVDITHRENELKDAKEELVNFVKDLNQNLTGQSTNKNLTAKEYAKELCNYYESIIACMPSNVYWLDRNGVLLGGNDNLAKMFGLKSRSELVGLTYGQMTKLANWTEGQGESFRQGEIEVMRTGVPRLNVEEPPLTVNGKTRYFISSKVPLSNLSKEIIGVVGISTDITEKKEAVDALEEARKEAEIASRAKSDFIANMSHDMRTPMSGISGMLDALLFAAEDAESALKSDKKQTIEDFKSVLNDLTTRAREYAGIAKSSAYDLVNLFNEILEVIQLESGKVEVASESFDFLQLIERNINMLRPLAKHKQLNLSTEIDDQIPHYLNGLRRYLDRNLLNLISNALKFTEKGEVKVSVALVNNATKNYKKGDKVTIKIQIKDTGIGIPNDKFEVIFEHFARLTPSYEGVKGSGLGLYTVKRYVEAMGGTVEVESEVGKGSCFTLILPFVVADKASVRQSTGEATEAPPVSYTLPLATPSHDSKQSAKAAKANVLLVEDNAAAALATRIQLERLDCNVEVAETGKKAIKKGSHTNYDLIFMDVGLPDVSGIEVTKTIRALADAQKSRVPIVALTGHAGMTEHEACVEAGMNKILTKPAQMLTLQSMLQQWVWGNEAIAENSATYQSTKGETPEKSQAKADTDGLPVIDWEASLNFYGGNADTVNEMLTMCAEELHVTQKVLRDAYAKQDMKALRDELHRAIGGVVYVKVPQLEQALKVFQVAVKAEPQDREEMERTYQAVQKAIQTYWKTLEKVGSTADK